MKNTCGDCRHPKMRFIDGTRVAFCPKKDKIIYLSQKACTDDAGLKIIKPLGKEKWGAVTKIERGINQNEERLF
jgi:hypothetical protein